MVICIENNVGLQMGKKTMRCSRKNTDKFLIQKICLIIGFIFTIAMSVVFARKVEVDEPMLPIVIKMNIAGAAFSLWISFAITFYVKWFTRQKRVIKVLSVVLFPITYFVFMCIGIIRAVPYTVGELSK